MRADDCSSDAESTDAAAVELALFVVTPLEIYELGWAAGLAGCPDNGAVRGPWLYGVALATVGAEDAAVLA